MTRRRLLPVALVAAVPLAAFLLAPPETEPLPIMSALVPGARGVLHVHTRLSDGAGTMDDVARAAAAAGLSFVVTTDHGDATRTPEPPAYRHGVLCIDAVEISTTGGHVVALGLPKAPYPLGGEPRAVVDDVVRLGGFAIAAHPASAKRELRWTDWDTPVGGLEWLNGDSEWRDERWGLLMRALFTYWVRAPESLGRLLDRPDALLQRWDALTSQRRVVAVAGSDAHARLALRRGAEPDDSLSLRLPGYEQVFRAFSIVLPELRLGGDAAADAAAVMRELRAGHVVSTIDALATPAAVRFTADSGDTRAVGGDAIDARTPVRIRLRTNAPASARATLLRNGEIVASSQGGALDYEAPVTPAVYRAEVTLEGAPGQSPVPWVLTNPIYVNRIIPPASAPAPATTFESRYADGPATEWSVEKSDQSTAALTVVGTEGGTQLRWQFSLGGTRSSGPFAALALAAGERLAQFDRLVFVVRADRPSRLSVQFRVPKGSQGERWQRSVYVDETPREISVRFDELTPIDTTSGDRPSLPDVRSVLFVADTVNTPLGDLRTVWIDAVRYGR